MPVPIKRRDKASGETVIKEYFTVAERILAFRESHPIDKGWGVRTFLEHADEKTVIVRAIITNPDGLALGSGFAEERRGSSHINKTSALENAETSAIGRALASAGFGGGGEYASADELANALAEQGKGNHTTKKPRKQEISKKKKPAGKSRTPRQALRAGLVALGFREESEAFSEWEGYVVGVHNKNVDAAVNFLRGVYLSGARNQDAAKFIEWLVTSGTLKGDFKEHFEVFQESQTEKT